MQSVQNAANGVRTRLWANAVPNPDRRVKKAVKISYAERLNGIVGLVRYDGGVHTFRAKA